MAQPAGTQYIIFKPRIYAAPLGSPLPGMDVGFGGTWPTEWFRLPHTEEGLTVAPSAPKDDITSDEAGGAIGVVPSGESEITLSFTPLTPNLDLFTWLASMQEAQNVSAVTGPPAFPAYKRFALTPEGKQFMIGVEGQFGEGSLNNYGGFIRAFGYKVEQTNEVEIPFRRTGEDAVVRLEAEVRCLVTTVSSTQLEDTGITATDERFDMFYVPDVS